MSLLSSDNFGSFIDLSILKFSILSAITTEFFIASLKTCSVNISDLCNFSHESFNSSAIYNTALDLASIFLIFMFSSNSYVAFNSSYYFDHSTAKLLRVCYFFRVNHSVITRDIFFFGYLINY